MLEVVEARYEGGYNVWLKFNDGVSGVVDLSNALWGPVFEPLRDVEIFKRFEVSATLHTLAWDNGADLAPEYLHDWLLSRVQQDAFVRHSLTTDGENLRLAVNF